jgi:hypothetical protein
MAYIDTLGDVLRVTMAAVYRGQQVEEMNMHYQCTLSGGSDSRALVLSAIDAIVTAHIVPTMNGSMKYWGSKASIVEGPIKPLPVTTNPATAGGTSNASLPTQVRGLVRLVTALMGRKQRGRLFVFTPDYTEADSDGNPTSAYQSALAAFATSLIAGFTAAGSSWVPVIYHRPKASPPTPFSVTSVTAFTINPKFATQRRSGQLGRVNTNPW